MLLSLADIFRCPADHEESALVLSVDTWSGQRVERGMLGCPLCHARYAIDGGVVDFRASSTQTVPGITARTAPPDEVDRVQALLNLDEPGGVILLAGRYTGCAEPLVSRVDLTCLVVNEAVPDERCVGLMLGERIPLSPGTLRAAAVDDAHHSAAFLSELARVLRAGGRLLAGPAAEPPPELQVLARDENAWIAEAAGRPSTVALRRARSS